MAVSVQRATVEPGSGATGCGFTSERWEAYSALLFLRARYYEPGTGRFVSQDPWSGDVNRPVTLHGWAYSQDNPMLYVDPSGRYHRDVHYDLTYDLTYDIALEIGSAYGLSPEDNHRIARNLALGIAGGDQWADQELLNLSAIPGTNHWLSHKQAREAIERELDQFFSGSTLSFGYNLHAVQDYFAHFGQGFIAETCFQGMNRWKYLYAQDDGYSVTGVCLESVNPIPLAAREGFAMLWGHLQASLLGFDPDDFDEADPWDQVMLAETEHYIREFLRQWFYSQYGEEGALSS